MFKSLFAPLLALLPLHAHAETMRDWVQAQTGQTAEWQSFGTLALPSGTIFIGDPSWGDDYHLRGASPVPAGRLDIWLLVAPEQDRVLTVWLEALSAPPATITHRHDFGTDSAYFAFGDLGGGQALLNLRDQDIPGAMDSHEFMFPFVANAPFLGQRIAVPPDDLPVFAVDTRADGGLRAVWVADAQSQFTGILIDIAGRASDRVFLDKLLERP